MKKSIIISTLLLLCVGTHAELSPKLELEIDSKAASAIFKAMDRFIAETGPDAFSEITYDCWPDGHKQISRKIEIDMNQQGIDKSKYIKSFDKFCETYDQVIPRGKTTKNIIDSVNSVRAYMDRLDLNARQMNSTVGKAVRMEYREGALASTLNDNNLIIGQTITIYSAEPGDDAAKACNDTLAELFNNLKDTQPKCISGKKSFTAETKNSGMLRVRSQMKKDNVTSGELLGLSTGDLASLWQKIYDTYMSFIGSDADISLTYQRKNHMLLLYSPTTRQINAACYKYDMIYLFTGSYIGDNPYLPANWTYTAVVRTIENGRVTTTRAFLPDIKIR